MRILPAFAALGLAACASRPELPPEIEGRPVPAPRAQNDDDRTVAIVNGQRVTWRQVAGYAMETGERQLVDQYIRWKLRGEAIRKLGVENSPEDLRARAQATVEQARQKQGDDNIKAQLRQMGMTEGEYVDRMAANPLFAERLLAEKALTYATLTEPTIDIDVVAFLDEGDAEAFLAQVRGGAAFDKAAESSIASKPKARVVQWPRRRLARGFLPPSMAPLEEKLFRMKEGDGTGLERTLDNQIVVVRVAGTRPGSPAPYAQVREQIMVEILRSPPGEEQLNMWMERLLTGSKIFYEDRNTARDKVR